MLGMMNCPTIDNFDFYSSSPRAIRQMAAENEEFAKINGQKEFNEIIVPNGEKNTLLPSEDTLDRQQRTSNISNPYQVFWGLNQRPKISYTEDGRRLIDGKLAKEFEKPAEDLWGRIIADSVTKNKLCHQRSNSLNEKCSASGEEEQYGENENGNDEEDTKQKRRFSFGSIFPLKKTKLPPTEKIAKEKKNQA